MRSLVGTMAILGGLAVEAALVMAVAEKVGALHWSLQALFYAVAGTIWVVPAAYVTRWMVRENAAEVSAAPASAARSGPAGSSARRSDRSP